MAQLSSSLFIFFLIFICSQNMQWFKMRKFSFSASTYDKSPILFDKYIGAPDWIISVFITITKSRNSFCFANILAPFKSQRNGFVFKICVWISVVRRKNNLNIRCSVVKISKTQFYFFGTPCSNCVGAVHYLYSLDI